MGSEYYLIITEKAEQLNYRTPVVSLKEAYYWTNRIIELGSKGVSIWENRHVVDVIFPKSKETE